MNAWIYGITFLALFISPLLCVVVNPMHLFNDGSQFLDVHLRFCLFPRDLSLEYLMDIPYIGILLLIASYFVHLHIYSRILERIVNLLRSQLKRASTKEELV